MAAGNKGSSLGQHSTIALMKAPLLLVETCMLLVLHAAALISAEPVRNQTNDDQALEFLITPWGHKTTSLVGENAELIKEWVSLTPAVSARRCSDGGILRMNSVPTGAGFQKNGPRGGALERFDADGRRTWMVRFSSETGMIHGEALVLPNGNVLSLFVERYTREEAIAHGRAPDKVTEAGLWADGVIEIRPEGGHGGSVVWKWTAWDHVIQNLDEKLPHFGDPAECVGKLDINGPSDLGPAWSRVTGLDYDENTDRILLVSAGFGKCLVIDRAAGRKDAPRPIVCKSAGQQIKDARWDRVADSDGTGIVAVECRTATSGRVEARCVRVNAATGATTSVGRWKSVQSPYVRIRPITASQCIMYEPAARLATIVTGLGANQRMEPLSMQHFPINQRPGDKESHHLGDATWNLEIAHQSD